MGEQVPQWLADANTYYERFDLPMQLVLLVLLVRALAARLRPRLLARRGPGRTRHPTLRHRVGAGSGGLSVRLPACLPACLPVCPFAGRLV